MDIPSTNTDAKHEKLLCSTRMSRFMTFGQRWLKLSDSSSVGEQAPREREVHLAMDGECRGKHNLSKAKHLLKLRRTCLVYVLQMPLVILSCISHLAIALLAPTQIPSISSASFLCLNDKMQEASTRLHTKSRLRPESLCDPSRAKKHQDHSGTEPRRSQGVFFRTWGGFKDSFSLGLVLLGPAPFETFLRLQA